MFSLTGTSKKIPKTELPQPGDNFAVVDLKAVGVRAVIASGQPAVQFGITTNGARSHPNYPAEFDVFIDADRDGTFDYVVFNLENGGFGVTGQNVVAVVNLRTNVSIVRFFADADVDSANLIATALLSDLGLTAGIAVRFLGGCLRQLLHGRGHRCHRGDDVYARVPRFVASGVPAAGVPVGGTSTLTIQEVPGGDAASPSQTGLLLLYRDGLRKKEASVIHVQVKITSHRLASVRSSRPNCLRASPFDQRSARFYTCAKSNSNSNCGPASVARNLLISNISRSTSPDVTRIESCRNTGG